MWAVGGMHFPALKAETLQFVRKLVLRFGLAQMCARPRRLPGKLEVLEQGNVAEKLP
jgi:hypothetical protein